MDEQQPARMKSIADAIAEAKEAEYVPVTFDRCDHVDGPFFHGTKTDFAVGDELVPGRRSNYHDGRAANHVYFAALLEPAIGGAELAVALGGGTARERIFVVEPTGPFEDDPNVTNKKLPGNVTQSYRTRHPMRIVAEVERWATVAPVRDRRRRSSCEQHTRRSPSCLASTSTSTSTRPPPPRTRSPIVSSTFLISARGEGRDSSLPHRSAVRRRG